MGYRPAHPKHRKGKPCDLCILRLEIELGFRLPPRPPRPVPFLPNPGVVHGLRRTWTHCNEPLPEGGFCDVLVTDGRPHKGLHGASF